MGVPSEEVVDERAYRVWSNSLAVLVRVYVNVDRRVPLVRIGFRGPLNATHDLAVGE